MGEIGDTLRERRMTLKIDVHEVEEATKIRAKYLRALENEEFNLLPGTAYVRSFLRTYADYLDLDSRALLDRYRALQPAGEDDPVATPTRQTGSSAAMRKWIVALAVVIFIAVILLVIGTVGGK